ncbi:MAG: hypothetical protein Kow0010_17020 [Dehalococcoidia bacterium]
MIDFERESRTPYSEAYTILEDGGIIGRVDLHFQAPNVYATLCTTADANDERIRELVDQIDERLVMTADPYREDFVVTVWRGSPAGVYSDADVEDEDDGDSFGIRDVFRN